MPTDEYEELRAYAASERQSVTELLRRSARAYLRARAQEDELEVGYGYMWVRRKQARQR